MFVAFVLITTLYYILVLRLSRFFDKKACGSTIETTSLRSEISQWISTHIFLFAFLIILLCWLPYLLIQYPGNVSWDGLNQLNQVAGLIEKTNHYPYVSTAYFGFLFTLGRSILDDNFGVFCIIIVQFFACAAIFAIICKYVFLLFKKLKFFFFTILFFSLYPVFPQYACTVIKDTLYAAVFALFILIIANILTAKKVTFVRMTGLILTGLMLSFFRSEGIYIVSISIIVLVVAFKSNRRNLLVSMVSIIAVVFLVNNVVVPKIGVQTFNGISSESLSLPFQQTARYIRDYGDDITPNQISVIEKTLGVADYKTIGEVYNPNVSDPVKKDSRDITNLPEYLNVWAQMLKQHPSAYIEATINGAYGYFSPFEFINVKDYFYNYVDSTANNGIPDEQRLNIYYPADSVPGSSAAILKYDLVRYFHTWIELPILQNTIASIGFYTWLLLFFLVNMIRKRATRTDAIFVAPLLVLATCVASPVNGLFRYAFPIIACMPVLIAFCIYTIQNKHHDCEESVSE